MSANPNPGPAVPRRRGWSDLVVKVCVVVVVGTVLGHYVLPRYFKQPELTDRQRWLARPNLEAKRRGVPALSQIQGFSPCILLFPPNVTSETASSGTVADCLALVPDGKKLDVVQLNLASGDLLPVKTDLYVPDSMPLAFTRTYYPPDEWSRKFQVYLPHVYDPYLTGSRRPYTYSDWLLPDRKTIHFGRISPGSGYADYIGVSESPDSVFAGSRIAWNGWGWDLALPDGATYLSPEAYNAIRPQQGSLTGIFDRDGREVKLTRAPNGDLQEIKSPSGQWIRLSYNPSGKVIRANASSGEYADYSYDSQERLQNVQYSSGRAVHFTHNSSGRVTTVADTSTGLELRVEYNERQMPSELVLNGASYQIRYFLDKVEQERRRAITHVEIQKPDGETTRI